jgi:hypothetical protein
MAVCSATPSHPHSVSPSSLRLDIPTTSNHTKVCSNTSQPGPRLDPPPPLPRTCRAFWYNCPPPHPHPNHPHTHGAASTGQGLQSTGQACRGLWCCGRQRGGGGEGKRGRRGRRERGREKAGQSAPNIWETDGEEEKRREKIGGRVASLGETAGGSSTTAVSSDQSMGA